MNKHGWTYKKLGEVCEIFDSLRKPVTKSDRRSGVYPYYGASGVQDYVDSYLFEGRYLLIGEDGAKWGAGDQSAYIIEGKSWVNNHVHILKLKFGIKDTLIAYYLNFSDLSHHITGAVVPKLTQQSLKNIKVPVPPIEEQEAIVAELDEINQAIAEMQQQIADLDALAQSTFYTMFGDPVANEKGWEVKKLKDISSKITNGNTPKGGKQVYVTSGTLFLRSQNVWRNNLVLDDVAYIDDATHTKMADSSLKHNDILITKTGRFNTENSSLGRSALFTGEDNSANINGHVYLVRLNPGMVHKFVLFILISESFRDLIRRVCVGGIDKRQLNKNHIQDFPIIFPPLAIQQKFVKQFEAIEAAKAELNAQIVEMQTLLASRMDYYFD